LDEDPTIARELPPEQPTTVGPYHIVQLIGEGGMGVVYAAEQVRPVRRRVALKMMKPGVYSKEVLARFEAERQALAVMEHPGIAKVLDAGVSDSGRPYFVMELVRGIRIDEYCDRNRLSVRARIDIFVQLCQAVQHAHQKGVIHRDLKPSNILVTEQGGSPLPKIIDFGIAKATGHRLTDATMMTTLGQGIGTLAYMSPEQAEASELDVDTRSDLYSLGIILYQLVTDRPPLDPTQTGMPSFLATLVSRDESMPTPAQRFASLAHDVQEEVAAGRATQVAALRRVLRGDLAWIVMKAIEKDRNRRYETANGLALDLGRYLASEPVLARPPSARYRIARFTSRHRAAVVLGGVAALALVLGTTGATVGLVQARRAEAAAQVAQDRAEREAETARQVSDFLVDLFEVSDPGEARGSSVTAREILDRGAQRVEQELSDQPLVQARLMAVMGTVYEGLGLYDDALPLLGRALDLRRANLPSDDPEIAASLGRLGDVQRNRGDLETAEINLRQALTIREKASGPDDDLVAHALLALGDAVLARGKAQEADSLLQRALRIEEGNVGEQHLEEATILQDLGTVAYYRSDYREAARYYERAIALRERLRGPDDPWLATSLNNLGGVHFMEGDYDEALADYRRVEEIWSTTLGPDHPRVATVLTNIAETYSALGRYREAEPIARKALEIKERRLSPNEASIANTLRVLADVYRDEGRYTDAEPRYLRAIRIVESVFGPRHARLAEYLDAYARMLRDAGRADEAEAVEARRAALGDGG
jgi:serine/threonine protein kinase/tetratricopeptide (TPR) repeat protein